MKSQAIVLALFIFTTAGSWFYAGKISQDNYVWVKPHTSARTPAAIHKKDTQVLAPVRVLSKNNFLWSLKAESKDEKNWHISMGSFAVDGSTSKWNVSCLEYPYMSLSFQARGVAVSGDKPQLLMQTVCSLDSTDKSKVRPIDIPLFDLKSQFLDSKETTFKHNGASFNLVGLLSDWPKEWDLHSLSFHTDQNIKAGKIIKFGSAEIKQKLAEPIQIR